MLELISITNCFAHKLIFTSPALFAALLLNSFFYFLDYIVFKYFYLFFMKKNPFTKQFATILSYFNIVLFFSQFFFYVSFFQYQPVFFYLFIMLSFLFRALFHLFVWKSVFFFNIKENFKYFLLNIFKFFILTFRVFLGNFFFLYFTIHLSPSLEYIVRQFNTLKPNITLPISQTPKFLKFFSFKPFVFNSTNLRSLTSKQVSIFYSFFKKTLVSLFFCIMYFLYSSFFLQIQFLKQIAIWFAVGMLFFWLISGFNFFIKRYQFGKFTSQIQRFWKRTTIYFWLIEGFLIGIYFYYFLNSSQEPLYMYDYSSLNQEYLISLPLSFMNIITLSLVIYFLYFILLRLNTLQFNQTIGLVVMPTFFLLFSFFIESYQFIYVLTSFREECFLLVEEDNLWVTSLDSPILRTKHQYFLLCLIAKYWHFLFIFVSWLFFLIKSFEKKNFSYTLLGFNLQNVIILFFLNLLCYLQWLKWLYKRFFDMPYSWFLTNDNSFITTLFKEFNLCVLSFFNLNSFFFNIGNLHYYSFQLWNSDTLSYWKYI